MMDGYKSTNLEQETREPYKSVSSPDSCVIVSGGLDSTILVYDMLEQGYTPHMLSFDYGQRHKKELTFASNTALRLGLNHDIIDLSGITGLISNSALTAGNVQTYNDGSVYPTDGMYDIERKQEIATAVGLGAVIFNDLKSRRTKDIKFEWETNTGPSSKPAVTLPVLSVTVVCSTVN